MPRRARIVVPGLPLHVVQRGNNRASCFFSDDDRAFYLFHLTRLSRLAGCDVHAYCLMTNHVHLLVTPRYVESCAGLMRRLDLLHTQHINRKQRRTGSLWEGRFRSCVVEGETYLLACQRYIEMNPVRAGLVQHPHEYVWSSYRANAHAVSSDLVVPHAEYLRLGRGIEERRSAYQALFDSHDDVPAIREATNGNFALGSSSFTASLGQSLGKRVQRGRAGRPSKRAGGATTGNLLEPTENVVRP